MPTILPVTDLHNYEEVLKRVKPGRPVFLTRNGQVRYAIIDIDDWDNVEASKALVAELDRGRASTAEGARTFADARARLAERMSDTEA